MAQYISKSDIVAEIKRRIKERDFQMKSGCWVSSTYMYEDLLDFINTLEVGEVDLEKEFDNYANGILACDIQFEPFTHLHNCAKYFF